MKKLMMSAILLTSFSASAVDINLSVTCGDIGGTTTTGNCKALTDQINDELDENLPDADIGDYGTGMANANGFAYKGLGSDYSDNFDYIMIRGAAGAAVDGDIDDPENADGIAVGASITVGLNLDLLPVDKIGPIDLEKMDLFVSFMSYDIDEDDKDLNIKGELSSFGVMARYQIVDGKDFIGGHMFEWGGVFLHTGFQRSSWNVDLKSDFDDQEVDAGGGVTGTFQDAFAKFGVESTTTTIPVEVSTYLRAGYIFTFYGGAGFDLVSGTTDVDLSAGGSIDGDSTTYSATMDASEDATGDADATNFRGFFGTQFNIPFVRVYAQVNKGFGNDLLGVNAGVKILW